MAHAHSFIRYSPYKMKETWPRTCGNCGTDFVPESWSQLDLIASKAIAPEVHLESRTCDCGCIIVAATSAAA